VIDTDALGFLLGIMHGVAVVPRLCAYSSSLEFEQRVLVEFGRAEEHHVGERDGEIASLAPGVGEHGLVLVEVQLVEDGKRVVR
jgi:hypothetical protein